jgi:putative transposase
LKNNIELRLKELLLEKANELNCTIEQMEVMPDHVHVFIKTPPTLAPHFIVQQLKGYSARILREEFPELKTKLPNMWTRSYFIESVGHISEDTVKKYIEEQKNK